MGGAFVAAVDDASAVYWNPGALASGALLQLSRRSHLVQGAGRRRRRTPWAAAGRHPGRAGHSAVRPVVLPSAFQLGLAEPRGPTVSVTETLITHNTGFTFVHSLADGIAIGTTARLGPRHRGSALATAGSVDDRLDEAADWSARPATSSTPTPGFSAVFGTLRAGLDGPEPGRTLVRDAGGGARVEARTAGACRSGVDLAARDSCSRSTWTSTASAARSARCASSRSAPRRDSCPGPSPAAGLRLNTLGDEPGGRAPTYSIGGSFAAAHVTVDRRPSDGGRGDRPPRLGRRRSGRLLTRIFFFDKKCHRCRVELPPGSWFGSLSRDGDPQALTCVDPVCLSTQG